jgi:hypothetical protein
MPQAKAATMANAAKLAAAKGCAANGSKGMSITPAAPASATTIATERRAPGWMYPDQYVLLGHEDVLRFPREAVNILFKRFLPESECQFETLGTGANRYQLYGNRMRSRPPSLYEIKEDEAWKTAMPSANRRLIEALS